MIGSCRASVYNTTVGITFMKRAFCKAAATAALFAFSLPAFAIFQNGGFESNDFSSWTTGFGINQGLTGSQPFNGSNINLGSGGSFRGAILTAGPDLAGAPITLPHVGKHTARVNNDATGGYANFISQADAITAADRDTGDNKLHVRFDYAVVLDNPPHTAAEQPFFFISVRDLTANTTLFEDFSFAGQTGTQFQPVGGGTSYLYLDWKHADVVVPDASIGHTIEVYLLASDCEQTGHAGYAYLDGFGSAIVAPTGATVPTPALNDLAMVLLGLGLLGMAGFAARRA